MVLWKASDGLIVRRSLMLGGDSYVLFDISTLIRNLQPAFLSPHMRLGCVYVFARKCLVMRVSGQGIKRLFAHRKLK